MATKIASFTRHTVNMTMRMLTVTLTEAEQWLNRFEHSNRVDDDDKVEIAKAHQFIERVRKAMHL